MKERETGKTVSKHAWLGEREHEDKGGGYDEGLLLQHHEKKLPISVFLLLLHAISPLPRLHKFLPGNSELEHQKEMTAEYENFYMNSTLNTRGRSAC